MPAARTARFDHARRKTWLGADAALAKALEIAADQDGVVSRQQLAAAGVPRWLIRRELLAERWRRTGRHTLAVHRGPLSAPAQRWVEVLEASPRAALDGVTALQAACVKGLDDTTIYLCCPRGARPRRRHGVVMKESRLFREEDVVTVGIRRLKPAPAAAWAARWAQTDRQAKLFVLLCAQQQRASVEQLRAAVERLPRRGRRAMLLALLVDIEGGVQSLGELDVAADMRRRGLPEPDRQALRRRPSGTQYLDCDFPAYEMVLEIDGAGHAEPAQKLSDLLRDLSEIAGGRAVIRLPLEIYHLDREAVLDRLEDVFAARGWRRPRRAA